MTRSLYSAVGGLSSHQFRMDVVGNDIANANTIGFKESRASFQSAFVQEARAASANTPIGQFVGLGVKVSGTQTLFNQGAFQRTDINTDIGIAGTGWLITANGGGAGPVTTPPAPDGSGFYTRAGNLVLDSERYLRTVDGRYIYGVGQNAAAGAFPAGSNSAVLSTSGGGANLAAAAASAATAFQAAFEFADFTLNTNNVTAMNGNTGITFNQVNPADTTVNLPATNDGAFGAIRIPQYIGVTNSQIATAAGGATISVNVNFERVANFSFATDGAITVVTDQGTTRRIGYIAIAQFNNDSGLRDAGSSYFTRTPASGQPSFYQPSVGPAGSTQAGVLELSNVDLANEFSDMIITQRGFDANARTISTASQMLQTVVNLGRG